MYTFSDYPIWLIMALMAEDIRQMLDERERGE